MSRLFVHPLLVAVLAWSLGWGIFDGWFGDKGPAQIQRAALQEAVERLASGDAREVYEAGEFNTLWSPEERRTLAARLALASGDAVAPESIGADDATDAIAQWDGTQQEWNSLSDDEREVTADPRPLALARADVRITEALLMYGEALTGSRLDPTSMHAGTWFAAAQDSLARTQIVDAVASGDAQTVVAALDAMQPQDPRAQALRAALLRLRQADAAPIPDGAPLAMGGTSIRIPHVRARLAALGYLGADAPETGWNDAEPYLLDDDLAGALARFRDARGLAPDSSLDGATTRALNADLDSLADRVALNVERWRHIKRDLGERYVWVNMPAYRLEVHEPDGEIGIEMTVNIGNAQTTGWTTPVISDSITRVVFRPAWFVPRSLAAAQVFPMARADSLSLWRSGFEVYQNGAAVDSRLVPWDSVSVGQFRFVQKPGPSNPLGRAKFPMTNPYAILIHDTNRSDFGGAVSSGCVHAGDAEALAAYLLRAEGWSEERAQQAYRRGPQRQGVPLAQPIHTHFVYLTAEVDPSGALVFHGDPYGYDREQLAALDGLL